MSLLDICRNVHPVLPFLAHSLPLDIPPSVQHSKLKNNQNEWIESTNSNLFVVYKGSLFTPSVKSGCVAGIMRMNIINLCLENGYKIYEHSITEDVLKKAEEVFLTNSINGISWVGSFKNSRYFNKTSVKLTNLLNKQNSNFQLEF